MAIYGLLLTMLFGVGYPPPSERDVLRVMQREFKTVHGEFFDPVTIAEENSLRFSDYPVDVILKRCDPVEVPLNARRRNQLLFREGYRCLVEIIAYAVPPFNVSGVFSYQGVRWEYYGYNRPQSFRPQSVINRQASDRSRFILKPGSIPYDGFPDDPINDVPSPYRDLLSIEGFGEPY